MPLQVIIGFKSFKNDGAAEAVYVGHNGDDAQKAVDATAGRFVRYVKFPAGTPTIPIRAPDAKTATIPTPEIKQDSRIKSK